MNDLCVYHAFLIGEAIYGDQARAASAKLLSPLNLPMTADLMHSAEGKTKSTFSPVKFLRNRQGFALLGYGKEGQSIVSQCAPVLALAWSQYKNVPVRQFVQHIPVSIELLSRPLEYVVPKVVVQRDPPHRERLKDPETAKQHVKALLHRSLLTQAQFLGFEIDPEKIKLEVLGYSGVSGVPLGHGTAVLDAWKNLRFSVNAKLQGYWSLGYLTGKGYGAINASLPYTGEN